jgi:hypothetical protein
VKEEPRRSSRDRLRAGAYLALAVASAAGAAWLASGLGGKSAGAVELPLSGDGVTLSRVGPAGLGAGASLQAAEGDWLLETDGMRAVVGSDADGVDRQLGHGALLDVVPKDFSTDALFAVAPAVMVAGRELPLRTVRVEAIIEEGRPALRVAHASRDGFLRLSTWIRLEPRRPWIEITTRAENRGAAPIRALSLGDRVVWPGAPSFAPRLGFVEQPVHGRVPFIARRGHEIAYALAFPDGADVDFRFDRIGPTEQLASSRSVDLEPGAAIEHRRALVTAKGGLASVAEHAWAITGKPTGRVRGKLSPTPEWATVEARHDDDRPVLTVRAASDGSFDLPLPAGRYQLVSVSPGGEDRDLVVIEAGRESVAELVPPDPGHLRFSAFDDRREPLPVRWLVRGIPPTKTPSFGPLERAEGAGSGGYSIDGTGRVALPPGRYDFLASHGLEYAIFEKNVTITAERGETLRAVLPRRVDTPRFIACDFHVHAAPSHDSSVTLDDRVRSLVAEGVEFVVATDHNHVTSYGPSIDRLRAANRLMATTGIEVTTSRWGHFNAYPYPSGVPIPSHSDVDPAGMFASIREHAPDALVQVNHPRMGGIGYFNQARLNAETGVADSAEYSPDFDVIEVLNGFELAQPEVVEKNLREWFALLSSGRRYTAVGNSDSHRLSSEWVGYPRTYVQVENDDPRSVTASEIAASLRAGRAMVTTGPFLVAEVQGQGLGSVATAENGRVSLRVAVRAPAWVDVSVVQVWLDGKLVLSRRVTAPAAAPIRLSWQTEIAVEQDGWLVVVVRGDRPLDRVLPGVRTTPLAFTNPIWIDADGDGSSGPILDAGSADAARD